MIPHTEDIPALAGMLTCYEESKFLFTNSFKTKSEKKLNHTSQALAF